MWVKISFNPEESSFTCIAAFLFMGIYALCWPEICSFGKMQ